MADGGPERTAVVQAPDEVDIVTAGALAAAIGDALDSGAELVVVDFTHVTFCDSAGLKVLVHGLKAARSRGSRLEVRNPSPMVRMLGAMLGLTETLGLPPDTAPEQGSRDPPGAPRPPPDEA